MNDFSADPQRASAVASRVLLGAAVLGLVACAIVFTVTYQGNVVDDALISFRYAVNLVEGRGLVFNPGERVEGYTNFLWTIVLAGVYAVAGSISAMMPLAIGTSIACAVGAVVLVWLLGRRLWGDAPLPTFAALGLVVLDNAYGVWAVQALEGHFLLVGMLGALYVAESRPKRWPVCVGLLVAATLMTRPDAALFALAIGASGLVEALRLRIKGEPGAKDLAIGWLAAAAVAAVVYGAYFAWRYDYYGWLLPNTFYVKVGGEKLDAWARGVEYVVWYFNERTWITAVALLALPLLRNQLVRSLVLFVALHLVYVTYVGGDFYVGHRFLLVVTPMLALLAGAAIHGASTLVRRIAAPKLRYAATFASWAVVLAGVSIFAWSGLQRGPYNSEIKRYASDITRVRRFSEWLNGYKQPGARIVVGDIGNTAFFGDIAVIDPLGIVDVHVAHLEVANLGSGKAGHEKYASRAYLLSTKPLYIKNGYVSGDLHRDGYYLTGDVPAELAADWLWVRDDLPRTGRYLRGTAFNFSRRAPGWEATGTAFAQWPTRAAVEGQGTVTGQLRAYVNTFVKGEGDQATGTLRSPPFRLEGDKLVLRVGGGHDPERLRVSLLVDGARVFSETGHNTETLTRRVWDIRPYRGRAATLEIVDEATGGWGHIMVDEVAQWATRATARTAETMR